MPFYHDIKRYDGDPDYPGKDKWVAERLLTLRHDLHRVIVSDRQPNSLIIGSWNIRAFDGGLPRLDESFHYIAEIIAAFDVCAIQEIKVDLAPLRRLMRLLGPNWDYFVTDVSDHEGGNHERMAFVYNTNTLFFRNLIGEIVIRSDVLSTGLQIARSPFFAAFQAGWFRFTLVSSHIVFGETDEDGLALRAEEIGAISRAIVRRARREDQVYIFLGDMNIDSPDGVVMQALHEGGLQVPEFGPTNLGGDRFYDQIAFTVRGEDMTRRTRLLRSGTFDWRPSIFGPHAHDPGVAPDPDGITRLSDAAHLAHYEPIVTAWRARHGKGPYASFASMYRRWMSNEMSDHLPVWVELETDYSDEYLAKIVAR